MRRRKLRWLAAAGVLALLMICALVLWPWSDRVTPENFDRIEAGMTLADLCELLGPPGDYRSGPTVAIDPRRRFQGADQVGDYVNRRLNRKWPAPSLGYEIPVNYEDWTPNGEWRAAERVECMRRLVNKPRTWTWLGDTLQVEVSPGPKGLDYKGFVNLKRVEQGPLDNLLWRVKQQWRRWFP